MLTGVMLVAFLGLLALTPRPSLAISEHGGWLILALTAAFCVSERLVFHVESRNEAVSYSPTDIALAIGVLTLAPVALLAARLVGAGVGLVLWRRQPLYKFTFNLTVFATETLVAVVLFRTLHPSQSPATLLLWVGLAGSLLVAVVAGGVIIAVAISFFESDLRSRILREFTNSYVFYLPGAVLGASAAVPVLVEPWLVLIFLVPAPLVWLVLRAHGSLMHRFTDLSNIHEFSSMVGRSTHLDEIADTAVHEIAGHLRAQKVALCVWEGGQRAVQAVYGDTALLAELPTDPSDADWAAIITASGPVVVDTAAMTSERAGQRLRHANVREAIAVALSDEAGPLGILVAADRHGATDHFDDGDRDRLVSITQQLTVALRKAQLHVQIQHEATHDHLTGLPNRAYFEAWTDQLISTARTAPLAVLMMDLDRFKEVNDTLGHDAGDKLLLEVTRRVESVLAPGDVASRFGGDEFALLVSDAGEHEASERALELSEALEQAFEIGESLVAISASIGIALVPDHGLTATTLLQKADRAMYDAKRRHERWTLYRDDLQSADAVRLAMLGDLRNALTADLLDVHFQPVVHLRTGEVTAMEALARWTDPVHGVVPPDTFIPLAEHAGLIGQLTAQVLDRSLVAVGHWRARGCEIGVAVNISTRSLLDEDLPSLVADCLTRADVPPHLLTLEITESTMIGDASRTAQILQRLDQLGVRISVDDFGTGYSSLVNLRHLPVSELKMDRSFVSEMLIGRNDEIIVRSTIDLAHNLGMVVIAEGVETKEVEDKLRTMGCDLAQGFGICKPLPSDLLERWLDHQATRGTKLMRAITLS
jgi:diguanylate cyclase (GGDEF)-like protein